MDRCPYELSERQRSARHGSHFCLGASPARLEAEIALPAIFARFPEITATSEPVPAGDSFIANAHRALPAVLRPTG